MAHYDSMPSKLEAVGNGSYLYRYGIQEQEVENTSQSGTGEQPARTQWVCEEVTVWAPLTADKVVQVVLTSKWDKDREQKLVNEYNGAQLGIYGSKTSAEARAKIQAYTDFLTERAALKAQVDADCEELGIR